jgi:hypothetical protein
MELLLSQGLFTAFDVYLLAVTVITAGLRLDLVAKVLRVLRRHREWPRVRKLLLNHVEILLGPRMLAPVVVYGALFTVNALLRTLVFPSVDFSVGDILGRPALLLPVAPLAAVMVARDLRSMRETSADFDERWVASALQVAEALLTTVETSERLLRPAHRGLLHSWLVQPMSRAGIEIVFLPDAQRWVGQLAGHTTTKLLVALSIWVTWAIFLADRPPS